MRIRIAHQTLYRYERPASGIIQILRLTPRNHEGQYVVNWRIEISEDCVLDGKEDAFGNVVHSFTTDRRCDSLRVMVEGEVETHEMTGIVRNAVERFPPTLFLRDTPLTLADADIAAMAARCRAEADGDALRTMHGLMLFLNKEMTFDTDPTNAGTTAIESFALRRGVCQDFSHIFIAASRSLGIPARYIGGYLRRADGVALQSAGHAWAEAYLPDLGWVAFDPTNAICATESHVRVAVGLDYLGAAPVRGTRAGGGMEGLDVTIRVEQAERQTQS
jgi:transglutaminase-like putative cysteine protease